MPPRIGEGKSNLEQGFEVRDTGMVHGNHQSRVWWDWYVDNQEVNHG